MASKYSRLFILAVLGATAQAVSSWGCSIFESPSDAGFLVSHNFDWYTSNIIDTGGVPTNGVLVLNAAGMAKTGQLYLNPTVTPASWVSKYRSATFSTSGAEFPYAGFNEKHLFIAILMLNDAVYPAPDQRTGVSTTQFVQYNLDMSSNIHEVIAAARNSIRPYSTLKMHYFTCDPVNGCAVLQYTKSGLEVYKTADTSFSDIPALTNSLYPLSLTAAAGCAAYPCSSAPPSDTSQARFADIAVLEKGLDRSQSYIPQAFGILNQVAQVDKTRLLTRFQLTYDPIHFKIYVRKADENDPSSTSTPPTEVKINLRGVKCSTQRPYIPIQPSGTLTELNKSSGTLSEDAQLQLNIGTLGNTYNAQSNGKYPFEVTHCVH